MVEKGDIAPEFTLPSDGGEAVTLSRLRGKKVVLYFYPEDDTPGCTIEACAFRDAMPRFDGVDAVILGVSPDSVDSHRAFRDKFALTFPLLADEDRAVCEAYGVWRERSRGGRRSMSVERSTFLIDEEGRIEAVWRNVKAEGHAEMLADLLGG
jgi:peroxiredoxin Q/BCP